MALAALTSIHQTIRKTVSDHPELIGGVLTADMIRVMYDIVKRNVLTETCASYEVYNEFYTARTHVVLAEVAVATIVTYYRHEVADMLKESGLIERFLKAKMSDKLAITKSLPKRDFVIEAYHTSLVSIAAISAFSISSYSLPKAIEALYSLLEFFGSTSEDHETAVFFILPMIYLFLFVFTDRMIHENAKLNACRKRPELTDSPTNSEGGKSPLSFASDRSA